MIKHLIKIVWNRKRANFLIAVEIFFSFLVLEYADEKAPVREKVEQSLSARPLGNCFRYALPDGLRRAVDKTSGRDAD